VIVLAGRLKRKKDVPTVFTKNGAMMKEVVTIMMLSQNRPLYASVGGLLDLR